MPTPQPFLPHGGSYKNLIAYQKAECVYDVTFYFAHHYLEKGDRTIDQMVQAARSGKQNIAEGAAAGNTSKETEIKLTNVAKASLQELLVDYEDFLRVRGLKQWQPDDARLAQTKRACAAHNDSEYYRKAMLERSAETIANIAITLIHQTDWLLNKLIEKLEIQFVENGGVKEQMTKARKEYRGY
ncbi:four helix bundle suffix domain-containing protein [Leyella stercorea]|uniref:four helix bundle suffix domain-containing protein n=1 Tax=Leyella stercorea TaxID=363265 RepID=UPI00242C948D|nr:four helix bundle suffix domain-containing protein [Leyella stercorea]